MSDFHDAPSSVTSLTPYLTLPHLLSLTWLAYPILSLIFVAFRLQLSLADAQNGIASAKTELLSSCKAAETAATSAASMPRFLAIATNQQYADTVNGALNAARATLILALTVMEAIINFLIDIYRSTFLCFLELIVQSVLSILKAAITEINNALEAVTSALRTAIQSSIGAFNDAISGLNKVNPFTDLPTLSIPSLDALQNISLPASFQEGLDKLNSSIPSVAELKAQMEGLIDKPFELVKQDINDTFSNITLTPEGLPVPALSTVTFCDQLDTSVIDDVGRDLIKMVKLGIVIIILLALLLIGLNCLLTWYKWRCMKNNLEYQRQAWRSDPTIVQIKSVVSPQVTLSDHNLIMLQANSEHPLITRIMNNLSARFNLTPAQHTHTQWFLHYITYRPALACLLIGIFGIISVQLQLWALGPLLAKYQDRAASTATDFSTTIAASINQSMNNQSSLYANEINSRVDIMQSTVNDGLFGWVNGTTTTLNSTLNNFYTDVQTVVNNVFGGTILSGPANAFLQCFIGSKVDAIENALTFLHDNLHIDIPRVNQTVLVLSPATVNEAAQPIALAAIGGGSGTDGSDNDGGLIGRLVNSYAEALRKERVMFAIFIGLWGVVVLMGLAVVLWHSYGKRMMEERGRRRYEREQRAGGIGAAEFFNRSRGTISVDSERGSAGAEKVRSFSPLPSPRNSTFRPFWTPPPTSPENAPSAPAMSQESVRSDTKWDPVFTEPPPSSPKKKSAKLLAIGRRAINRGERLKKDGSDEELYQPPAAPNNKGSVWFGKVATLLTRKDTQKSADYWDSAPQEGRQRPQLMVQTKDYQPDQEFHADNQMRSRFSVTPDATKTSYMNAILPSKRVTAPPTPTVVVSPPGNYTPYTSTFPTFPFTPNPNVPTDVGASYSEDPFSGSPSNNSSFPIPLYAGFDSLSAQFGAPPRHPQLTTSNGASPALALPSATNHRRSVSAGGAQWRVTNAVPGDSRTNSVASAEEELDAGGLTPVTRLLTTTHARQSSLVNPFITPFDDEHRVQIDHATGLGARKSMATNPFAHAI